MLCYFAIMEARQQVLWIIKEARCYSCYDQQFVSFWHEKHSIGLLLNPTEFNEVVAEYANESYCWILNFRITSMT